MTAKGTVHFAARRIVRVDGDSRDLMETHCGVRMSRAALEDLPEDAPWCATCEKAMEQRERERGGER
ncbi:MAG: hypothetical protein ACT4PV_14810 [Planctomycetaceae bacterium]